MKQKTMKAQMEEKIFEGSKAVGIQFFQVAPHEIVIRVRDKVLTSGNSATKVSQHSAPRTTT